MSRRGRAAVVALVALAVAGACGWAGVAWLRARLEQDPALRGRLARELETATGLRARVGPISVHFAPAAVELERPVLLLPGEGRIELAELHAALRFAPLLAGEIDVESMRVSGPARLAVRGLDLSGRVAGGLEPSPSGPGYTLDLEGHPDAGGVLWIRGRALPGDGFEGDLGLDGVDLEPLSGLLASEEGRPELVGRYRGRVEIAAGAPGRVRLASDRAWVAVPPLRLAGSVSLEATMPGAEGAFGDGLRGHFRLDAASAEVDYLGARLSGRQVRVEGAIARTGDGRLRLEDLHFRLQGPRGEWKGRDREQGSPAIGR